MGTAWITSMGKGIVDGGGHLLLCDECPCGGGFDCEAAVKEAIRERQPPAGRTQWTVLEAAAKNFVECVDEVGAIAPSFTLETISEGDYVGPAPLSSTYAQNAADWCELYEWIRVLLTTVFHDMFTYIITRPQGWISYLAGQEWLGLYPPLYPPYPEHIYGEAWSTLISNCAATWAQAPCYVGVPRCRCYLTNTSESGQSAMATANGFIVRLYAPGCETAVSARVYVKFGHETTDAFASQGWIAFGEGQYVLLWEASSWAPWVDGGGKEWKMLTTDEWPPRPIAFPVTWPPDPGMPYSETSNGILGNSLYYLLDWDFVYV